MRHQDSLGPLGSLVARIEGDAVRRRPPIPIFKRHRPQPAAAVGLPQASVTSRRARIQRASAVPISAEMISTAAHRGGGDLEGDALDSEWLAGQEDVSCDSETEKLGSDHSASEEDEDEEEEADDGDDLDELGDKPPPFKVSTLVINKLGVSIWATSLHDVHILSCLDC